MINAPVQHFYTVKRGDTLSKLARRFGLSVDQLSSANNIANINYLSVGQQLSIPKPFLSHRVMIGDTIFGISQMYGVAPQSVINLNQLTPPYTIFPEQLLLIPPGLPYYTVQPGDTLYQVAKRYNVKTNQSINVSLLQEVNQLANTTILPGMQLIVPYAPPGGEGLIAYNSNHGGFYDLWLYHPTNGTHQRLTNHLTDIFTVPFWSRDGIKIAFVGLNHVVFVLNLLTGQLSQIDQLNQDDVLTIDWSNDHQTIAYTKGNHIVLYNTLSHQAKMITKQLPRDVQWFPNGEELLFSALDAGGMRQMYKINIDSSNVVQFTNQQAPVNFLRLSPNGTLALFTSPGASISIIHTLELDTGNMFGISGGPLAKDYNPVWSPDSSQLAYSATALDDEQGYYSLIKTAGSRGENDLIKATSNCFSTPISWSPNAQSLIYLTGCTEESFANSMWYVDLNTMNPIQLFNVRGSITSLSWSST